VALQFPQVIQRPPEVNDEERRRILREVSQSRFWSSEYEDLVERAIADKTTNVLVALLTARWKDTHCRLYYTYGWKPDETRIMNLSWFATCKPLLVNAEPGDFNDKIMLAKLISYFEPGGRAADTTDHVTDVYRVLRRVAKTRPLCVVLDGLQHLTTYDFKGTIHNLLDTGVMVICVGCARKNHSTITCAPSLCIMSQCRSCL
jgi:hypothetical protein